jgi:hypothetical protein
VLLFRFSSFFAAELPSRHAVPGQDSARSIVRVPPDTLTDGKARKHPLEYGLSKVFFGVAGGLRYENVKRGEAKSNA